MHEVSLMKPCLEACLISCKMNLCLRLNGLLANDKLSRIERSLCDVDALSDITDEFKLFDQSFIELEGDQNTSLRDRAAMQLEDYRSHELRDEEQMMSYDQFVETSLKFPWHSSAFGTQSLQSGVSLNFDDQIQEVNRLERDYVDLAEKICSLRSHHLDWTKVGQFMEEAQKLLGLLNKEFKKAKVANVRCLAKAQQLDIQKEKTKQYQTKLKTKMDLVRKKAMRIKEQEDEMLRKVDAEKAKLTQFKEKIFKVLNEDKSLYQPRATLTYEEIGSESARRTLRTPIKRRPNYSREKFDKILEETQRQNRNFQALMPKLATGSINKTVRASDLCKTTTISRHVKRNSMPCEPYNAPDISFKATNPKPNIYRELDSSFIDLLFELE